MRNRIVLPVALVGVGLAGGIGGAAAWEAVVTDDGTPAASIASPFSQGISTSSTASLAELYRRAAPGVVEITARSQRSDAFGGSWGRYRMRLRHRRAGPHRHEPARRRRRERGDRRASPTATRRRPRSSAPTRPPTSRC